jgi:hypothetical protein
MKMQPPEYDDYQESGEPRSRRADILWNLLSIIALLAIVGVVALVVTIFQNPANAINPFPPATMPVALVLPTSTPTQRVLPPTWTPTVTITLTPPVPTDTPEAPTLPVANSTSQAGTTTAATLSNSNYSFVLQGDPVAVSSSIFHPTGGCQWFGVGGNVFDLKGSPVFGLVVNLGGYLNGSPIENQSTLTGLARNYGESGYEFTIQSTPVASTGSLWVQIFDQSQIPVSDRIYFNTYSDCQHNLILINFKQAK